MSENKKKSPLDCGCCDTPEEALRHHNYPGQDTLSYRLSRFSGFKRRMLHRLGRQRLPEAPAVLPDPDEARQRPLLALTTRAEDDPTIALLDAWAVTADVLTFYQERIANEGFLRTATERMSVLELARAIGYELNPGVAAGTYLAFTVDDAPGAPGEATVPAGTQVQSIPKKQGELPQTFETGEEFKAYREWNQLQPQQSQAQPLTLTPDTVYLKGANLNLKPGDRLLFSTGGSVVTNRIRSVSEDLIAGKTTVFLTSGSTPSASAGSYPPGIPGDEDVPFTRETVQAYVLNKTWQEGDLQVFLRMNQWSQDDLLDVVAALQDPSPADGEGVFAFEETSGIFGNTAPLYQTLPSEWRTGTSAPYQYPWDNSDWQIWYDSRTNLPYTKADIFLDRTMDGLEKNSWIVLRSPNGAEFVGKIKDSSETALTGFGLSGKVTGIDLYKSDGSDLDDTAKNAYTFLKVRTTTVYAKSRRLTMASLPDTSDLAAGETELTLDNMVLGLQIGQPIALTGEQADAAGVVRSEVLLIKAITHAGGRTTLTFTSGLANSYFRESVTLNANVVAATHGETVQNEILGSGDGTAANQHLTLKKNPLTYTSAATTSGAESTLEVRVDGVRWTQEPSLYGLTPTSRAYTVRIDDDAVPSVIFGDGRKGARLPTGQQNITATYRTGIGQIGEVDAGSLTLLKTRPYGVRGVVNPQAASGAADPEKLADARENAPLSVLTLDRIVSLSDYEDFARAFAGIGKALAVAFWNGEQRLVHLTVADSSGDVILPTSDLYDNLRKALDKNRDPEHEVRIDSFVPVYFDVEAKVRIQEDLLWDRVRAEIEDALQKTFAFEARGFSEPVSAAEVIRCIHGIEAVEAVDLDVFEKLTGGAGTPAPTGGPHFSTLLSARRPSLDPDTGAVTVAELLMINPYGIQLTEMDELEAA